MLKFRYSSLVIVGQPQIVHKNVGNMIGKAPPLIALISSLSKSETVFLSKLSLLLFTVLLNYN
jgi:hypothetical protein